LSQVIWKPGDSHFWADLIKTICFPYNYFSIKDGSQIRLWEDRGLGNATLGEPYHALYNMVHHKSDTLAKVMKNSTLEVTF
jgi:hypothetical protein